MATRERARATGPLATTQTPTSSNTSVVRPAMRLPGEQPDMPDAMHSDQVREQWMRERGRRELVISSLRAHLAEQPSPRAVRACARRWIADVNYIADGVIAALNSTENE